jgi:hypothetical protein
MHSDPLWKPVEYRGDFQIGFQDPEPSLNICEAFVAINDILGLEVEDIGQKNEFPIKSLRLCDGVLVHFVSEHFCLIIRLDESS